MKMMSKIYKNWTFHNLVSHPLSEIAYLCGLKDLSGWLHDVSVPDHTHGTGRG
jgi:hypothetical protein